MKKHKTFNIQARIVVDTGISIKAESLKDAVEIAEGLKMNDFVTVDGEVNDFALRVTGVADEYSSIDLNEWPKETVTNI